MTDTQIKQLVADFREMKREIKFRAWDKRDSKMFYSNKEVTVWAGGLEPSINTDSGKIMSDFELMQFTGLKDKNGKEIYESDLISENGSSPYEVIWQFHSVQWIMQSFKEGRHYREMAYDYAKRDYEVIGNIYENPELIK